MDIVSSQSLQKKLIEIYRGKASEQRISTLFENLSRVIDDKRTALDEIVFFVDEFEGGSSESPTFDLVLSCVIKELDVNKENAQRLFDFYTHCKNAQLYSALVEDYADFLTNEQLTILSTTDN